MGGKRKPATILNCPFLCPFYSKTAQSLHFIKNTHHSLKLFNSWRPRRSRFGRAIRWCLHCQGRTWLSSDRDIKIDYRPYGKLKGEDKIIGLEKFFGGELPTKLKALEKTLSLNDDWLIGNCVSLADISLFSLMDFFDDKKLIFSGLFHGEMMLYFFDSSPLPSPLPRSGFGRLNYSQSGSWTIGSPSTWDKRGDNARSFLRLSRRLPDSSI